MLQRICHLLKVKPPDRETVGLLRADGDTVPADGTTGYATGCIFQHTDGGEGTVLYLNEGDADSCDFNPVASLTAAQEALLGATAGTATASKALVLNASGQVDAGTLRLDDMTPGTGIAPVTNSICEHSVVKVGGLYKTTILIDLTGLNSGGTANDIIGKAATANCHLGRITAAKNGTIFAGRITCLETPATGDDDIDLYAATAADGTEDAAATSLAGQAILANCGDHSAGSVDALTAYPSADDYLYLAAGTGDANATYTAGILLIELWGK